MDGEVGIAATKMPPDGCHQILPSLHLRPFLTSKDNRISLLESGLNLATCLASGKWQYILGHPGCV